jgi:hypothetical protein
MSRSYPLYSQPLWRRALLTRESAVLALLAAVVLYALGNVRNFDGLAHRDLPAAGRRARSCSSPCHDAGDRPAGRSTCLWRAWWD